jgi:hypothetical protein
MQRTFLVTVVTEVTFVGEATDELAQAHLGRLTERLSDAAAGTLTRVTSGVHVTWAGGGVLPAPDPPSS